MSITKVCPWCDSTFEARVNRRIYCSRSCRSRATRQAHPVAGAENPNWRGGKTRHPLYEVYSAMRKRCSNPNDPRYADYGGRGIQVCEEWSDFWRFVADVGPRPDGVGPTGRSLWSLDRVDNDGHYEPGNVRWASAVEQRRNSRERAIRDQRGPSNACAKLTEDQVRQIRSSPLTGTQLAETLGVSKGTISLVRTRRTWRHVT